MVLTAYGGNNGKYAACIEMRMQVEVYICIISLFFFFIIIGGVGLSP
jgi:hypothetical protein